ncbi:hypothetical protein DRM94_04160 [Aeromonas taiwanensis]|uniref:Uncharacterized protein n=1 Tax=Aeromonas taiwanensis TaxID=633417 RepID=A0A5F0KF17_9GAMM|nr:hypothetical protein DRM93_04160 [Aeromonas taiwanensis]TFF80662.1 hypothetical protein DRM95_04175 [Aeromonas taiwanensis]TFF82929.1 hypothetical protein DRM94_04160 [Aeromonas taiwanensis]
MINRHDRLRRLEKAYAPHVLAGFRFIGHVEVAPDDARCGTHADIAIAGSPIGELVVYAATREGYVAQREALRRQFQLLEG